MGMTGRNHCNVFIHGDYNVNPNINIYFSEEFRGYNGPRSEAASTLQTLLYLQSNQRKSRTASINDAVLFG
jgi:hypothetical protein